MQAAEAESKVQAAEAERKLQAAEAERKLQVQAKEAEMEKLMQSLAPLYNRRAVEKLTSHLANLHPVCRCSAKDGRLITSATIRKLRLKLNKCSNAKALRGAATIYKTLSEELGALPFPLSIESARWTGLTRDQKAFMDLTYSKLKTLGLIEKS